MNKLNLIFLAFAGFAFSANAKNNVNTKPYPYGNPVITHMYTADASPHVMPDGRVWMVTSVDLDAGGGYSTMHSYHTFSSSDMVNWIDHGPILTIEDVAKNEPANEDWALWAPDMIYKDGLYYLYYPVNIRERVKKGTSSKAIKSYIAVAVSDHPAKPFKIIQEKIPGTKGIDPSVFRDDDGKIYLYWGSRWVAELADNMIEFSSPIKSIEVDKDNVLNTADFKNMWTGTSRNKKFKSPNFMEGPWMHKRNGRYYFNYHTQYGNDIKNAKDDVTRRKSHLDYSYGDSPWGPLKYGGVLNYELGVGVEGGPRIHDNEVPWRFTQSNHGGVVEFHGNDYLFYHTSALSSWRQDEFKAEGTWTQRSVCIDVINYTPQGDVIPVKQTIEGVGAVKVKQPFEVKLAKKKELANGVINIKKVDFGTGYYYFDALVGQGDIDGKLELRLGSEDGMLVGTCNISPATLKNTNNTISTAIRDAKGVQDLYLVWKGSGDLKHLSQIRIFAGSPIKKVAINK